MTALAAPPRDYPIQPVPFTAVQVTDGFWLPRLEAGRTATIPHNFRQCEQTGRIDNFLRAAHKLPPPYQGYAFNDSDVFKVMEGAAYALALRPDPELDKYLDELIAKVAATQEPDGYLYAARTTDPANPPEMSGPQRYCNLRWSHELYNVGHLYEAAVAHFLATGKRSLLEVALKSADHVDREFGPGKRVDPPGHEEIEIGLVKLYRVTGEERYLKLAKFFLDARGRNHDRRPSYEEYAQDHIPVTEQSHAIGHAVRAVYLYSAMADVAALTGDTAYAAAIDRIWENMVGQRLYVTGGIGARHGGEAFGADYELPNQEAYCETCAAIASCLWNQRMFLRHGDGKYIDVLERTLYNGMLAGVSLTGDRFFYVNPLASDGRHERQAWFACACCPPNVARFLQSVPGYVYAQADGMVFVNLFVPSRTQLDVAGAKVTLEQQTRYPWDGRVTIRVQPERPVEFALRIRVPGWATGKPVPSDLYAHVAPATDPPVVQLNGQRLRVAPERGYVELRRPWQAGDVVELTLPMPVNRVRAHPQIASCAGRVALERGPLVYCAEAVDNGGRLSDLVLADGVVLEPVSRPELLGGVTVLRGRAERRPDAGGSAGGSVPISTELTLIPYYAWAHRERGEMAVWLPCQ